MSVGSVMTEATEGFEPKIAAFVCNWCTYAGADLTGTSRIKYATNVRIIRFPCTGRIDFLTILKAISRGVDGIIVSGCHPNDCHYTSGNFHARRRWIAMKSLLEFMGFDTGRLFFSWLQKEPNGPSQSIRSPLKLEKWGRIPIIESLWMFLGGLRHDTVKTASQRAS